MAFDNSSNARRKRKLAAKIKKGCKQLKAAYRADLRKAEAAALAKKNEAFLLALPRAVPLPAIQALPVLPVSPALNLTLGDIAAILEAAQALREQHREVEA